MSIEFPRTESKNENRMSLLLGAPLFLLLIIPPLRKPTGAKQTHVPLSKTSLSITFRFLRCTAGRELYVREEQRRSYTDRNPLTALLDTNDMTPGRTLPFNTRRILYGITHPKSKIEGIITFAFGSSIAYTEIKSINFRLC